MEKELSKVLSWARENELEVGMGVDVEGSSVDITFSYKGDRVGISLTDLIEKDSGEIISSLVEYYTEKMLENFLR